MALLPPSITGDALSGQRDGTSGVIRNLSVIATGYGSARATFLPDIDNPDSHDIGVYTDGDLTARLNSVETQADLAGLLEGSHTLSVRVNEIGAVLPNYHGDDQGQRAYLQWVRSTDPKCVGYRVYWDAGADETPAVILDDVIQVEISERINQRGSEDEAGRVTWYGGYSGGDPVNDLVTVTLADTGEFDYNCIAGNGEGTFEIGQSLALPYGIILNVLDDIADYGTLSTFEIPVGPMNSFLTDTLDPGDYRFLVVALDEAGNETEISSGERKVRIYDVPDPLTGIFQEWDPDTETMTVGWNGAAAEASGIDHVNVYSNYSAAVSGLAAFILEDVPFESVETDSITFARADTGDGEIMLYLRPVDAAGEERKSVSMVRFMMPPTAFDQSIVLSQPVNVKLVPDANGALRMIFDYPFDEELDHVAGFEISLSDTEGGQSFAGTLQVDPDEGSGFPVANFEVGLIGPYTETQYAVVRAYAAGLDVFRDSDEVSATPVSVGPDFDSTVYGLSQ